MYLACQPIPDLPTNPETNLRSDSNKGKTSSQIVRWSSDSTVFKGLLKHAPPEPPTEKKNPRFWNDLNIKSDPTYN